jgi:hypothetical protein
LDFRYVNIPSGNCKLFKWVAFDRNHTFIWVSHNLSQHFIPGYVTTHPGMKLSSQAQIFLFF